MSISLSKNSGFCPGVVRADKNIEALIKNKNTKIYTLGNLIHNRIYNDNLRRQGVNSIQIQDIEKILYASQNSDITLVIRTHGITKEENSFLSKLENINANFHLLDMTCPYVKKIHQIADENTNEETVFLLFCDPKHPEAKGIMSYAKGDKYAFSSIDELRNISITGKIPILCSQTTQNLLEFEKIKIFLKKLYTNLIFFDTICNVTEKRQNEAVILAKESDAMIVIGGKDSSNTHKLYDLCKEFCNDTVWIETAEELKNIHFEKNAKIGITAGASTPDDIILEVLKQWKKN